MTQDTPANATSPANTEPARRKRTPKQGSPAGGIFEQAISLRTSLQSTLAQTNELIRSLKQQRKQQQLVRTTLKSLKDLQAA